MTEASTGLRKALARGQSGTVQTLAEMSNDELLANLSDEQKTALAASLAPAANAGGNPEPEAEAEDDDDDAEMKDKKKSKKDGDDEYMGDDKARAERDRCIAVMSSEHAAGRAALAADLLANDKLSADEIVKILASAAPGEAADPEAGARAAMQDALTANAQTGVEANNAGGKKNPAANAADIWAHATAKVFGNNKSA